MVKRAFLLAAGLATRLQPLTLRQPKQLLPLPGQDAHLLAHHCRRLVQWGVTEVAINVSAFAAPIQAYLQSTSYPFQVKVYEEGVQPMGTWQALRQSRDWLKDEPIFFISTDVWSDMSLTPWLDYKPHFGHLLLQACDDVGDFTCDQGRIGLDNPDACFAGMALLHPRLLDAPYANLRDNLVWAATQPSGLSGEWVACEHRNMITLDDYQSLKAYLA